MARVSVNRAAGVTGCMIVLHYMELKHAPLRWRLAFELWPIVAATLILGIWFFTGTAADCPPTS